MAEETKEQPKVETTEKKVEDPALETQEEEGVVAKIVARNEGPLAPSQSEETKPDVPVVTEEMVKDYPGLKTMVGKPVTELLKSYGAMNTRLSQSENELNTLKTAPVKAKEQEKKPAIDAQITKSVEEEIDELIEKTELPDPLDDPKAHKKELAKLMAKVAKLQSQADTKPLQGMAEERQRSEEARASIIKATELVASKLPEGVDMTAIHKGFGEFIAPVIAENPTMYHGKPELLASDIASWYYMEENKRLTAGIPEEKRKEAKDQMTALKTKIEGAPEKETGSVKVKSEDSGLSPAIKKIIERNEGKMPEPGVRGR